MILLILALIGALIFIDGIGRVFIQNGQYHNFWFDGERYARAAMGAMIILIAYLLR